MPEKTYSVLVIDEETGETEQKELVQEEAFELVSEGLAKFVNQGVDWDEYVQWRIGQDFQDKNEE